MNRVKMLIFTILVLLIGINNVYALSVSKNDITIEKGKTNSIELYANSESEIASVDFTLVFSTYDIPAYFAPADGNNDTNPDGIAHHIILGQASSGKVLLGTVNINVLANANDTSGVININTAKATTSDNSTINLNAQNINITVGTPTTEPEEKKEEIKDKNLLEKIESNITKIELKKDVFEYTITIKDSVTELDLKPVPKDKDTKVDITTQKIKELKDNKITITAKNGSTEQKYVITVKIDKAKEIKIDNEEFKGSTSYKSKWVIIIIILVITLGFSLIFNKKK